MTRAEYRRVVRLARKRYKNDPQLVGVLEAVKARYAMEKGK